MSPYQQCPSQMHQIPLAPGPELNNDTGAAIDINVPDDDLFIDSDDDLVNDPDDGENQSLASQPSTTDPSPPSEEETSMVDGDITGPDEDEKEDTENDLETNGNTEETSESEEEKEDEDGRSWRLRSERQTDTNFYTATVPPPQVASHQGPPPQVASHQGPPPQVASHQGPPPPVASHQGPPPQVASHQGPPPPVASHQGPPPQVASHQGPPQQVASHQGPPPPPVASHQGPPPQVASHQGPPPPVASHQGPPPQVASHQGPPPQVASHQGPPPQVASHQGPPPPVASHQGPPPPVASHQGPPPQVASHQGPPPPVASHQGPPPPVASHQGPPPPVASHQGPPPPVASHQGPPPQVASHQGPPPQVASHQGPPPQVASHQEPPQQQQQPQINDIVEDEEVLDEEENVNDTGLIDERSNNLDEEVGMEEEELNEQVDAPEVDDLNMAGENQSFASQPSMTAPISSTPLTTTKSEKPKPSTTSEEETSMVDADITGPEEDKEEDTENDQEQLTVNGATCEQELNMTDKSATRKRRSAEAALDDELLQDESPTKKIKDIVEDKDALMGNSDEEENMDDTGFVDEQNYNVREDVGMEEQELNDVPGDSLVDDLNMTSENQSFASQPSTTAPISSTPLTTPKSKKPKPSTTREEETSIVDAGDTTGPDEDEEEDTENDPETNGSLQDIEETSESEEGRGGMCCSERQMVTGSLESSRPRITVDLFEKSQEDQTYIEEMIRVKKIKKERQQNSQKAAERSLLENYRQGRYGSEPWSSNIKHEPYFLQHQQQMARSWNNDLLNIAPISEHPPACALHHSHSESWLNHQIQDNSKMVKLFDICYHLAKQELRTSYYPSLVNLEYRHGVELGLAYQNQVHAHTFTEFIAKDIRSDVDEAVRKARYISILIDGSTDRSTSKKELMYVKYLKDGIPCTRFFSILDVKNAHADGILEAINTAFQQHNIPDWEKKLIGICADGASVNFRCRKGVIARLAAEMPWLLDIHCIAHQLELASKDAFKDSYFSKEIDAFLTSFTSFYCKSPKQVPELNDMADVLEEKILQPTKADGTRLVLDHRRRALLALVKKYTTVVAYLTELGSEQMSDITKDDAVKARGMVKKMSSYKFLLHMALYMDVLEELSDLSRAFQQDDISLSRVMEHLEIAKSVLNDMADGLDGAKLNSMKRSCVEGTFQGVTLSGMEDGSAEFDAARNDLVQPLVACIGQRFSSFTENEVFSAISSLDPKTWPNDLKSSDFSDRDAQFLIEHFNDTLVAHGCDPDKAYSEWLRLKKVIPSYYKPTITWQALWGTLFQKRQAEIPNFLHIIEMVQVLPFATVEVESGCSLMNRMKSDWRVLLNSCELDDLMMISLEGPSEEKYNTSSAVARWHKADKESRCANVQP